CGHRFVAPYAPATPPPPPPPPMPTTTILTPAAPIPSRLRARLPPLVGIGAGAALIAGVAITIIAFTHHSSIAVQRPDAAKHEQSPPPPLRGDATELAVGRVAPT